jgi:hypothetical protein
MVSQDGLPPLEVSHLVLAFPESEGDRRYVIAIIGWRVGELDLVQRVHVKVLSGRHPRQVRLVKSARDEERTVFMLLEYFPDAAGCGAIRLVGIRAIRFAPNQGAGFLSRGLALLLPLCGQLGVFLSDPAFLGDRDPGPALGNVPLDLMFEQPVRYLAHACRKVTVGLEVLRHKQNVTKVGPRRRVVIENPGRLRAAPAEQRGA